MLLTNQQQLALTDQSFDLQVLSNCFVMSKDAINDVCFTFLLAHGRPGHRARNSDSTSIYYYKIRELKKTFKFNSGNPNYLPKVSFKWKKNGPKLINFTPDKIKQIDKRIVWGEISTW